MNIKVYIDQFSEISHLKREQQFILLESAYKEANSKLKFLNFPMITFLVRTLFITILVGGGYLIFGYSAWLFLLTVLISLLFSRVAVTEIHTRLILTSLKSILLKQSS